MFNRRSSNKPTEELYRNFKANFPELSRPVIGSTAPAHGTHTLADALDIPLNPRPLEVPSHDMKDADPTPRGSNEPWNFGTSGLTPSLMDPNSHTFNIFANQLPGYYTPTPGGTNTLYHHQAGDLHTPSFGMGINTPLSLPTSEGTLHAGQQAATFHGFQTHLPPHIQQPTFQNLNPFQMHQQPGFPPHHFSHQPSFEGIDSHIHETSVDDVNMDVNIQPQHQSPQLMFHHPVMQPTMQPPPVHPSGDSFRFHVTLNAPTAMIKHAEEIPITYLNKGQAYTLNVVDTHVPQSTTPIKYRTFVRISFEDEQQRQKPAACWQLWKEGRGANEAHHRGGRLQAVEYVESGQLGNAEDPSKPNIELESSSYDGFSVIWTPPIGASECPISVRFNFLSTDFSHSKGVKGIPVRLCAKTEIYEGQPAGRTQGIAAEVCYCKVKLFRDHGAERKLSNDVAHVKKTIDKLNQQIAQIESGMRDLGKRKRGSIARATADERPGKVPKHRRTWSVTSVTSSGRGSAEEDLHMKLRTLQDMFTSTRPASVLYLRGDEEDDPDLYPVKLSGDSLSLVRTDTQDSSWERQSSQTGPPSSLVSPSPSSHSLSGSRRDSNIQQPTPFAGTSRVNSDEWRANPQTATMDLQSYLPQQLASPPENQPVKVQTRSPTTGIVSGWVEAVGVDPQYQPPPERAIKPVACFYIQPRIAGQLQGDAFYRAIYLMQRTVKDFTNAIAMKCNIEPTKVLRVVRISRQGLQILFDEDCIRELAEGQDMGAEFVEIQPDSPSNANKQRGDRTTEIQCDGDVLTVENVNSAGYELRILY